MQVNFREISRDARTLISDIYNSKKTYLGLLIGIVVGLILCALFVNGFYQLFDELTDGDLEWFDDKYSLLIQSYRSPVLTEVMLIVSWMGDRTAYIIFTLLLFIFFYLRYGSLILPIQTSVVLLFAGGLNRWLKDLIERQRPSENHLLEVSSMSFPSGHAMSSIAFFGFLIYLVWRLVSTNWLRWILSILLVLLILAIGFSRVYLGVHYPSDVLAGYAAGGACLAVFITAFIYARYRYLRKGKKQVGKEEKE